MTHDKIPKKKDTEKVGEHENMGGNLKKKTFPTKKNKRRDTTDPKERTKLTEIS
jgi:hypothetical protein